MVSLMVYFCAMYLVYIFQFLHFTIGNIKVDKPGGLESESGHPEADKTKVEKEKIADQQQPPATTSTLGLHHAALPPTGKHITFLKLV
jgi:hypothetical protein